MAAAPIAIPTASQPERFVRLCPQHGTHVSEEMRRVPKRAGLQPVLICPEGDHTVNRWCVWDRRMSKPIGYGTRDNVLVIEGECDDVLLTPRTESRTRKAPKRLGDRLAPNTVLEIARLARGGANPAELALSFGVDVRVVYRIRAGERYRSVTAGLPPWQGRQ